MSDLTDAVEVARLMARLDAGQVRSEFCVGMDEHRAAEAEFDATWADFDRALAEALGESLNRVRLAMTALDLEEPEEAAAILSALCAFLVEHGAIDPLED